MSAVAAPPVLAACHGVTVVHGHGTGLVTALADAELAIREGERVALYGASGSGKTTLLHVLGGLIVPSSGEVTWRNEPLSTLDAASRGRVRSHGIAFIFQGANLLPNFTATRTYDGSACAAFTGLAGPVALHASAGIASATLASRHLRLGDGDGAFAGHARGGGASTSAVRARCSRRAQEANITHTGCFRAASLQGRSCSTSTCATLQARIGDTSGHPRPAPAAGISRSGVGLITARRRIQRSTAARTCPASRGNAAIMPLSTFSRTVARELPTIAMGAGGASAVPGAQTGVQWQVQASSTRPDLARPPAGIHRADRWPPR